MPTLVVVAMLTALTLAAGWLTLNRPLRLATVALAQCSAVLLAFVLVNDQYIFYASWRDLLGQPPPPGQIVATGGRVLTGPSGQVSVFRGTDGMQQDGGRLITEVVHGGHSGITAEVLIRLPPGYATSTRRYPVVELLSGWHGYPYSWISSLHVFDSMAANQQGGAVQPFITVIPSVNVAAPRDVECTDVPHGPQAETWLTTDVRDLVLSQFRALHSPRSWGLMGYSTGGYCAAKFALHKPAWYGAAVSISGYFGAVQDASTGDLWGGSPARRHFNDPVWLAGHRARPPIDMLVFSSKQDKDSYGSSSAFLKVATAPMQTFALLTPRGGHNLKVVRAALPEMLSWMSGHLRAEAPVVASAVQKSPRNAPVRRPLSSTSY